MQSDPWEDPRPDAPRRHALALPWRFVVAGFVFLAVLAPLVPDEPMHLSGVMVVLGLAFAALAFFSGVASGIRSDGSERPAAWSAAASGLLLVIGWLGWWVAHLMSQLS